MSIFDNMKSPRPALRPDPSFGRQPDVDGVEKAHELKEVKEKVADLKQAGIKPTVVVEAD